MLICEKCGQKLKFLKGGHRKPCDRTPVPQILAEALNNDANLSLLELAGRYHVSDAFIRRRLQRTDWTKERLRERGIRIRNQKLKGKTFHQAYYSKSYVFPQCISCCIIVDAEGDLCKYCLEEKKGVKNYRVKYGIVGQ